MRLHELRKRIRQIQNLAMNIGYTNQLYLLSGSTTDVAVAVAVAFLPLAD